MSADMTLTQEIFNTISAYYDGYFFAIYEQLMQSFILFFRTMMIIYTIYLGYKVASGKENYLPGIIKTYLTILILYTFTLETNVYNEFVVTPFMDTVEKLSVFFAGGESTSIFASLDQTALDFIHTTAKVWPNSLNPLDHLFAFFAQLLLYFFFFTMFFAFLVIYCISYFAMNVFFLLGGIFILLGAVKETRGLFFAWLRNLFQFGLTIIFASITLGLTFKGIVSSVAKLEHLDITNIFTFDYLSLIAWCAITIVLFLKCADFAAGVTSTMAGSTAGIAGAISGAGGIAAAGSVGATSLGGGAVGGIATKFGAMAGVVPPGMSATEALKQKLGIK